MQKFGNALRKVRKGNTKKKYLGNKKTASIDSTEADSFFWFIFSDPCSRGQEKNLEKQFRVDSRKIQNFSKDPIPSQSMRSLGKTVDHCNRQSKKPPHSCSRAVHQRLGNPEHTVDMIPALLPEPHKIFRCRLRRPPQAGQISLYSHSLK
jgi:hypothetical protein